MSFDSSYAVTNNIDPSVSVTDPTVSTAAATRQIRVVDGFV